MENVGETVDTSSAAGDREKTATGEFKSGLTWRSMLAILYAIVVFSPAVIWLQLVTLGVGLHTAIEFCTLLLFAEYVRMLGGRISKQEGAIIFNNAAQWVAGGFAGGSAFVQMIYRAYFVQSPLLGQFNMTPYEIPQWWVPPSVYDFLSLRTFFHPTWTIPFAVAIVNFFQSWFGAVFFGLILREIYMEVEDLYFPMERINVTAVLTITERKRESLDIFTVAGIIGIAYGAILYAIPTYTKVRGYQIQILPIPWVDFTTGEFLSVERLLPGATFGFGTDIGLIATGFMLPINVAISMFIGSAVRFLVVNPLLIQTQWSAWSTRWDFGMDFTRIYQESTLYYWLSPLIGVGFAVGLVPLFLRLKPVASGLKYLFSAKASPTGRRKSGPLVPKIMMLSFFLFGCVGTTILDLILVPSFPIWALILYNMVFPLIVGLTMGRMIGVTGQAAGFPYLNQLTIMMSGYRGVDAWFLPFSFTPGVGWLSTFKIAQLSETSPMSFIKVGIIAYPLSMLLGFVFTSLFWTMAPIPSATYPTAGIQWPISIMNTLVWIKKPTGYFQIDQILYWFVGFGALTVLEQMIRAPLSMVSVAVGLGAPLPSQTTILVGIALRILVAKVIGKDWINRNRGVIAAGLMLGEGLSIIVGVSAALVVTGIFARAY